MAVCMCNRQAWRAAILLAPRPVFGLTRRRAASAAAAAVFPRLPVRAPPPTRVSAPVGLSIVWSRNQGYGHTSALARRAYGSASYELEAFPFSVGQQEAVALYNTWATQNTPFFKAPVAERVTSVYLPFWCFTCDVHVKGQYNMFGHGPRLQVYSGDLFPRDLLEFAKNDALQASRFSSEFLNAGPGVRVDVEPFALFEASAWKVARADFLRQVHAATPRLRDEDVTFHNVISRRVLMPVHVVEYRALKLETFRFYVNAVSGAHFGLQQKLGFTLPSAVRSFLDTLARTKLASNDVSNIAVAVSAVLRMFSKVLMTPPFLVGSFFAFSTYVLARLGMPIARQRLSFMRWREQRATEHMQQQSMSDEWAFRPTAAKDASHRAKAAADTSAWSAHAQSWSSSGASRQTTSSSRSRWSWTDSTSRNSDAGSSRSAGQQTASAGGGGGGSSSSGGRSSASSSASKARASTERTHSPSGKAYIPLPSVRAGDHYDVLGLGSVNKRATVSEIKAAFRRELLKYHPDHQQTSGFNPEACSERTRLIIEAYGELRDPARRAAYDRTYRG